MSAIVRPNDACLQHFVEGFFAPIAEHLADSSVSEILINGPGRVYVERRGKLASASSGFASRAELLSALRATAQYLGRPFDAGHPILEGRLPDGSRIEAVLDPVAADGPCVAIRRHRSDTLSLEQLVESGSISAEALELFEDYVAHGKNIMVAGGTGTGKTSLLRCISMLIPEDLRVVTIEDARELHLSHRHLVSLEARPADERGKGALSIGDLFHATLRMRPDRIVIGELRGAEALDLIQAMTSGHGGCMSTIHASTCLDVLHRLETLALYRGLLLPLVALRSQIASAVDVIVLLERGRDGSRYTAEIAEVMPLDQQGNYRVHSAMKRVGGRLCIWGGAS